MKKPAAALIALAVIVFAGAANAKTNIAELLGRPAPKVDARIPYGKAPQQFGDLYLPKGNGLHPVIVAIHGGCWLHDLPNLILMQQMSGALRDDGFAVWNIEYRRIGEAGGGYPGTFADIGNAVDALRGMAGRYHLDMDRVTTIGHSAGGPLALWAAARGHLPATSPLRTRNPLKLRGAVSISGIADLAEFHATGTDTCGGPSVIDKLVGAPRANAYADTSPASLLPLNVPQLIVTGSVDTFVPARFGHAYSAKAAAAGDTISNVEISGAEHFDLIDPKSAGWPRINAAIEKLAK